MPALSSAAMSSDGMPHTRSRVSARSAVWLQITSGTYRSSLFSQKRRSTLALAPSRCRSSSAARVFSTSATTSRGRILSARGWVRSTRAASELSRAMSASICFDARAQHLDHHLAAIGQRGRMHLCDRGRGQRFGIEAGECLADRQAECFLDDAARGIAVERLDPVLQQGQFVGHVRRHQVAAGGQDLAELDEDRAEILQRQARAPRDCTAMSAEARGTNGLARRSQRSAGVPCSRSSRR